MDNGSGGGGACHVILGEDKEIAGLNKLCVT